MSATAGSRVSHGQNEQSSLTTRANEAVPNLLTAPVLPIPAPLELRLGSANAGDHYPIFDFLVGIFRAPSSGEFQAQLEEPWYEPTDRLVVKHGARIVSHLRMYHRETQFGNLIVQSIGLAELATLPAYRKRGLASALIAAAEDRMRHEGAALGFVRTSTPELFARRGWVVWGRHCYSVAGTRDILAQWNALEETRAVSEPTTRHEQRVLPLSTRIWRHVERGALMRLYAANSGSSYGPPVRNDDYWRWLVSRRGYGSIYVVIEGRDKLDLDETPIIGYAVTKAGRIVELMTDPSRPYAVGQLLKRVCGDAIERDIDNVRLDAPPDHHLHSVFVSAGGQFRNRPADHGQVMMAKLIDPIAFLRCLEPTLIERARISQLSLPAEVGIAVDDQRLRLVVTRRSARVESSRVGRAYISCSMTDLMQLILGQIDVRSSLREKQFTVSTRSTIDVVAALFPRVPFWRPPWDEMPA